jgi:hypothetical protein
MDMARALILAATLGVIGIFSMLAPTAAQTTPRDGVRVIKSDATSIILELSVPTYQLTRGAVFDALTAPGAEPSADAPGDPQLPVRGVLIAIPQGAEINLRVLAQDAVEIPGRVNLSPIPTSRVQRNRLDTQNYNYAGVDFTPNPQTYARDHFEPGVPVRAGATGFLRSQRFAQITLFPFQYNAAQQRVRWIARLVVEAQFIFPRARAFGATRDEGAFERVLQNHIVNYSDARSWRAPRLPRKNSRAAPGDFKIAINATGVYRLTYAALVAAGAPTTLDPRTFKIKKNGNEIPILVHNESAGVFDASVAIDFYGVGLNTVYTDTNIYWLSFGGAPGIRMSARDAMPIAAPDALAFRERVHREQNHFYVGDRPFGNGDHWYWHAVTTFPVPNQFFIQSPATYTFTVNDARTTGTATLRANVFGAAGNVGDTSPHHQKIFINGTLVADDSWVGDVARQIETTFAQSLLITGTNALSLTLPNDTGLGYDEVLPNWFEIEYDRLYRARDDALAFASEITGAIQITLTNFSTPQVALYDMTDPHNVARLINFSAINTGDNFKLAFSDNLGSPARYVALADGALKSPLSIARDASVSDLKNPANGADMIIIAADDFYTATATLATHRAAQGLRVARVKISDVYDEFSDGVFDPNALRAFLADAYANWQPPAPQYVLLVGDGNLNYRNNQPNNLGFGFSSIAPEPNFIPPYLDALDPFINETASDNFYARIVGDDHAPDLAIGRLPARSAAEAAAMIEKIIVFERATPGDWRARMFFFSDNYYTASGGTDSAGNFYATADAIITDMLPSAFALTRAYYDPAPSPPNPGDAWHYPTIAATRNAITTALNASARFVNYVGHGSQYQWASENLFGNANASPNLFDAINNGGRTPVVLELTCKTGMFHLPGVTTLAESFVRAPGQGAVADWASTGLGVNAGHDTLAKNFFAALFNGARGTLGVAMASSKTSLVASGFHLDLVDTFTLLGDPATIADPRFQIFLPVILRTSP